MSYCVSCCVLALPFIALADGAVERRLHIGAASASSFLWNDWNKFQQNYHPSYVGDGDPKSAWVEGAKDQGVGEWIKLPVSKLEGTSSVRLRIQNGYQRTKKLYALNSRIKTATVTLSPSGIEKRVKLKDQLGWQTIEIKQPPGELSAITFRIEGVYPGTRFTDTCVSDIEIYATATAAENPSFERSKLERLLTWKKDRAAAAKEFKKAGKRMSLFAGAYRNYWVERADSSCGEYDVLCQTLAIGGTSEENKALVKKAEAILEDPDRFLRPSHVVSKRKQRMPPIAGLFQLDAKSLGELEYVEELPLPKNQGFLRRDTLGYFDTDERARASAALRHRINCRGLKLKEVKERHWVYTEKDTSGREVLSAVLIYLCGRFPSRIGFDNHKVSQLLVYGPNGKLRVVTGDYDGILQWGGSDSSPRLSRVYWDGSYVVEEVVR